MHIDTSKYMIDRIGEAAMLEQAAEEATEFAKAALKKARIIRGENPTPVTIDEANANLIEEWTDQVMCADQLRLHADFSQVHRKRDRFMNRWNDTHGDTES